MPFLYRAAAVALLSFLCTIMGFGVRTLESASYLEQAEGMVRSIVALEASLLALVLGLLISTCHGLFTMQLNQWQALGRAALIFDMAFSEYGVDAENGRQALREMLRRMRGRFWKDNSVRRRYVDFDELSADIAPVRSLFASLQPTNDEQRRHFAKGEEAFGTIFDTQLTMLRSLVNPVPNLLFNSVVGWACLLFFGYGLLSSVNLLTSVMAALGAVSVGGATLLVLELSDPYVGLFRMAPSEFDRLVRKVTALPDVERSAESSWRQSIGLRSPSRFLLQPQQRFIHQAADRLTRPQDVYSNDGCHCRIKNRPAGNRS